MTSPEAHSCSLKAEIQTQVNPNSSHFLLYEGASLHPKEKAGPHSIEGADTPQGSPLREVSLGVARAGPLQLLFT